VTALPIDVASAEQARQISAHLLLLAALRDNADTHKSADCIWALDERMVRTLLLAVLPFMDDDLLDRVRARWLDALDGYGWLERLLGGL